MNLLPLMPGLASKVLFGNEEVKAKLTSLLMIWGIFLPFGGPVDRGHTIRRKASVRARYWLITL
jgi:hypothetical protein